MKTTGKVISVRCASTLIFGSFSVLEAIYRSTDKTILQALQIAFIYEEDGEHKVDLVKFKEWYDNVLGNDFLISFPNIVKHIRRYEKLNREDVKYLLKNLPHLGKYYFLSYVNDILNRNGYPEIALEYLNTLGPKINRR